jgi:lipid A disaccharide synthetase
MSTPIEFMETDELIHELKKRFDEMLFIGYQAKKKNEDNYSISVKSTLHGSYGLIEVLTRATDAHAED